MAYTEKQKKVIINAICDKISEGMALRTVLMEKDMPSTQTFYIWIDENEDFSKQYARATSLRGEAIFEDILKIADNQEDDMLTNEEGVEYVNHNVIQRARLRVDSRKWYLSKLLPKKYGEKLDLSSDDGSMTPKTNIITTLTPDQLKDAINK